MDSNRHYPVGNSQQDIRILAEKLWNAIDQVKAQQAGTTQTKSGLSTGGSVSGSSAAAPPASSSFSGLPTGYDLVQRRVVGPGESIKVTADYCVVVVDYLEVQGYLEFEDTKGVVL